VSLYLLNNFTNQLLIADPDEPSTNLSISSDSAIWHDGFIEDYILNPGSLSIGSSQVAPGQIGFNHVSGIKESIDKFSVREVGVAETGVAQSRTTKVSTSEIGRIQTNLPHGAVPQNSSTQIDSFHENLAKVGTTQIAPTQIGTSHIIEEQGKPREVSFSGSVPPQQLFTVNPIFHDNLARISDSITTFWNRVLAVDTPFDNVDAK
jgi:hypothetical protein